MATFTDHEKRDWHVRITNKTVRDVKFALSIDLRELLNDDCKPLMELVSDSLKLAQVLYVACREQLNDRNVSEDSFLDAIYGDVSEKAAEAFCEAFVDFFPNPQLREAISKMLGFAREMRTEMAIQANETLTKAIESTDVKQIISSFVPQES